MSQVMVGAVWVWGLASIPEQTPVPLARLGRAVFWILVIAHVLEIVAYYDVIRSAPGSIASNIAQTFLWGSLYLREIGAIA